MKKIPQKWKRTLRIIMKLYILLLTINISLVASPSTFSQDARFNIKLINTNIIEVLNIIQEQSEYHFLYNNEVISKEKTFDIEINNGTIDDVLSDVLKDSELNYKCQDNIIILTPKSDTEKTKPILKEKQPNSWIITGVVNDESEKGLPGVNVVIKGTTDGTSTDVDGKFKLKINEENAILVFSFIGYETTEVKISSANTNITVQIFPTMESLEEVIVVAYNEQSKASFTGAAVAINLDKIKNSPRESFNQSLQGNSSGLYIQSASGQPGSFPTIRIRGIGSVSGSSSPLYVVDGIPISHYDMTDLATSSNIMAGINPEDIETITVLKDASATSLYGSRGANGVILITTKKGKKGKTKFNFTAQHGVSEIIWLDRNKPLRTPEITELLVESRENIGETQEQAEYFLFEDPIGPMIDASINTDWFDVLTRQGNYDKYALSASGGSDNTSFYTSLSYHEQEGTIIGVDYEKLNAKLNLRNNSNDKVILDLGVALNSQIYNTAMDGGTSGNPIRVLTRVQPWYPVYNEDGSYNTDYFLTYNPVGLVNENIRETKIYSFLGNTGVKWYFLKGLSFESKINGEINFGDEFKYDNPNFGAGRTYGGRGTSYNNKVINWNWTNLLRYRFNINLKHKFEVFGGHEAQEITKYEVYTQASNYSMDGLTTLENTSTPLNASTEETGHAIESYLLSLSYNFSEKYHINLSARRDGSSRFGSDVRWANFGSIGAAWNISKESFFKPIKFISEFKLRGSYGVTGNQSGIGDHESKGLYQTGVNYNGEPGIQYYQQENALLTWEKNIPFNIALDFEIYKRISGTVEYYYRKTNNLLLNMPVSRYNGISNYAENIGEIKNQGWEFEIKSQNIASKNFTWVTDFNISTNQNEVTYLPNGPLLATTDADQVFAKIEEGYSFYSFFLPAYAGVDPENGDALWYTDESKTGTTNDYSDAEWFYQGSPLPKYFGGLTNTFSYKEITLSFLFYYQFGNVIYDTYGKYVNSDGSATTSDKGNMSRYIYENRWQEPGDITDVPKVVWGNTQSGLSSQNSTRFLYEGDYIRLRDITLSYTIPLKWTEKINLSAVDFYFRGSNIWTWTKDKTLQIDPEVGLNGISDLKIPATKQWVFGLNISF